MSVANSVIPPAYDLLPTEVAGRLGEKEQLAGAALSLFVIDSLIESRYTPAAPKGVSGKSYLTIELLAIGS
jgi:hypothetical protein